MFGDNKSVVNSSMTPHSKLHKRHNALSLHRVREAIAMGIFRFIHLFGGDNPSNMLSKHWAHQATYPTLLRPLMHFCGDAAEIRGRND